MDGQEIILIVLEDASIGPRSENRGYASWPPREGPSTRSFNGSTVREPWLWRRSNPPCSQVHTASMGPRSENRGYERLTDGCGGLFLASMGPRSENRGYGQTHMAGCRRSPCFNGSTV